MGEGTWSGSLVAAVEAAVDEARRTPWAVRMGAGSTSLATVAVVAGPASAAIGEASSFGDNGAWEDAPEAGQDPAWPLIGREMSLLPPSLARASFADLAEYPGAAALRSLGSVCIAGPFGQASVQLQKYRHFLLFAGGIGITPIASLHHSLARGFSVEGGGKFAQAQSITTVWSAREIGLVKCFAPLLVQPPGASSKVLVHVSPPLQQPQVAGAASSSSPSAVAPKLGGDGGSLPWPTQRGRPDIPAIFRGVTTAALAAAGGGGSGGSNSGKPAVAVVVCGPPHMVSDVLAAAAAANSIGLVDLHVHKETFSMREGGG